jgi:hypothetical protein
MNIRRRGCGLAVHRRAIHLIARLPGPKPKRYCCVRSSGWTSPHLVVLGVDPARRVVAHRGLKQLVSTSASSRGRPWVVEE